MVGRMITTSIPFALPIAYQSICGLNLNKLIQSIERHRVQRAYECLLLSEYL